MNRRCFLQSIGALGLTPLVPTLPAWASIIQPHIYSRAEMIVRAHNSCSLAMLQRHLKLDWNAATELSNLLLKNGIITAKANAYGIHAATSPLSKSAFLQPLDTAKQSISTAKKAIKAESKHQVRQSEKESEIKQMESFPESDLEQVESICEDHHEPSGKLYEREDGVCNLKRDTETLKPGKQREEY